MTVAGSPPPESPALAQRQGVLALTSPVARCRQVAQIRRLRRARGGFFEEWLSCGRLVALCWPGCGLAGCSGLRKRGGWAACFLCYEPRSAWLWTLIRMFVCSAPMHKHALCLLSRRLGCGLECHAAQRILITERRTSLKKALSSLDAKHVVPRANLFAPAAHRNRIVMGCHYPDLR
jgi:hypothetical protein